MLDRLAALTIPPGEIAFRDTEALRDWLYATPGIEVSRIGASRNLEEMFGYRFGEGTRNVSVIAGCHADEPVGPMTAQLLAHRLRRSFPELLERFRFHVIPQMNPDGAENNRGWFTDPFDLQTYLQHVHRELPGDDIEFGWSTGPGVRPEVTNAMTFLRPHAPYEAHFSLHGMAFAKGAWCLLSPEWIERAEPYMDAFAALCAKRNFPLHDVDRKGEKGFTRIREGFCTHPNSTAMKRYFLDRNDSATAQRFRPSSMEWVRAQGGDPLCIVSELPLFLIDDPNDSFRQALDDARTHNNIQPLIQSFQLRPVPPADQIALQLAMIVLALTSPNGAQ